MKGRRVMVVGGSAGIGRAFAVGAVRAGADVVLCARRQTVLAETVADAGGGTAVAADLCDPAGRRRMVDEAVDQLGEIDLLVSTVGGARLRSLVDADAEEWRATTEVNVLALNQLLRLVVPHMAGGGVVAALSSESAAMPWAGLVPYAAAKAALEASLRGWRIERPEVRFCCVVVGATQPTGFGTDFEPDQLGPAFESWIRNGRLQEEFMSTDDVASVLRSTLESALDHPTVGVDQLVLRSPSPAGSPTVLGR